jgi:methionyl-tRNA formyltransferase
MTSALVFAYHNVGVACLQVLIDAGVRIPLVVSHEDNAAETIWFDSVANWCSQHNIPCITPNDVSAIELNESPDFIFSFYYRHMLPMRLLAQATRGAYNMHGSLLPKYRGRVPINWAIIHGESETGASLHAMVEKPDAGDLIDQQAVPIEPNDTALIVFNKVVDAARSVLQRSLPKLIEGTETRTQLTLSKAQYFGGRKPSDGCIDWASATATSTHNLVRALAPPYPAAYFEWQNQTHAIHETRHLSPSAVSQHTTLNADLSLQFPTGQRLQITAHAFPPSLLAALPLTLHTHE